jgi:PAS domain S-box-containing protein
VCNKLLGYKPEELTGQPLTKFIHPEDRTIVQFLMDHIEKINEIQPLEYRIKTKDGRYLWMETTVLVIRDMDTGQPFEIQTTSRNITERVKAVEALRESEIKLRSVITQSQDGIMLIDEEGRIIEWGKGQEKISGIPASKAIGEYIWDIQSRLMPELIQYPETLDNFKRLTMNMLTNGSLSFGNTIQESTLIDVEGKPHRIQTLAFPIQTSQGYMAGSVIRDVTGIKHAEEELYKSEERLRFITDNMLDMISYVNRDQILEYVSPSVTSITGYQESELVGLKILAFIHPDDQAVLKEEISRSIKEGIQSVQVEYRFRHNDGHYLWMESMVNLLVDKEGEFSGAIYGSRDISEKKKVIDALRDSESRYRTLARNFPNGAVMLFDKDLRYRVADGSGLPRINLSREQLEGHTIYEIYTPETVAILEPYYRAVLKGRAEVFEVPIDDVTYEIYAVPIRNESGVITFGMVMTQDVTERKQAVVALKSRAQYLSILNEITRIALEESDLKLMMQQIVDLLAAMFLADHCYVTSWNPDTKQTIPLAAFGPMREQFPLMKSGPGERTLTESAIEAGTPIIESDLFASDNISSNLAKKFPSRSMLALPLIGGGEDLGAIMIGFVENHSFTVDEMNRAEQVAGQIALSMYKVKLLEEVRNSNIQLENRVADRTADLESKNRELETFTYSVSHDLKAPLRGIDGYSRMLLEDHASQLDAEGLSFLNKIRLATKQMNQLIEDLLSYSRLERRALTSDRVDIHDMVCNLLLERKEDISRNNIEMIEVVPPMSISIDGKAVEQALRNLIDNAIKFSSGNVHPMIKVSCLPVEGNSTILSVEDNGIGFDMKYCDRIFDIFQRLHLPEEYPGTGIGLALVKKAMLRIGGRVWAESRSGEGAKFYLEIPG